MTIIRNNFFKFVFLILSLTFFRHWDQSVDKPKAHALTATIIISLKKLGKPEIDAFFAASPD